MQPTDTLATTTPTAARPLLGLTVLAVEDSRYACDALRLMCLRSGARLRRADCLRAARRHLAVYRPTIAIVDLGLPDGSGSDLIAEMAGMYPRVAALLATSGDPFAEDVAVAAGADGFLPKPYQGLAAFQATVLSALPRDMRPSGPRLADTAMPAPDPAAYRDDMAHAADLLSDAGAPDESTLDYLTQFLSGVARSAGDDGLVSAVAALSAARQGGATGQAPVARLSALLQSRLTDRVAI